MFRIAAAVCGLLLLCIADVRAGITCTLLADAADGRVIHESGDCATRNSPASTFKLPLAVMGFDAGTLKDAHTPRLPYREDYKALLQSARQPTDPTSWLRNSVLWYSQALTVQLGMPAFQRYVDGFDYGNRDLSGDPGQQNGLTQAWIRYSSLQISPREQVAFLRRLLDRTLPVSRQAQDRAIAIMPVFPTTAGWTVHGKTGGGFQRDEKIGSVDRTRYFGWFVGWADRPGRQPVVFARLIKDDGRNAVVAGPQARDGLLTDLPALLGRN